MLRRDAADSLVACTHFGLGEARSGGGACGGADHSIVDRHATASRGAVSRTGLSGFLSERDAATYLGMSTAQLAGLRKFDLAMIEEGFKPHGPPPLWRGGICSYASESLDEWVRNQSTTNLIERLNARQEAVSR